jgi:hypothetical protein
MSGMRHSREIGPAPSPVRILTSCAIEREEPWAKPL